MRGTFLVPVMLVSLMCGCMLGPAYRPPDTVRPGKWGETLEGGATARGELIGQWWKGFNDPLLDTLIERALRTNTSIRVAEARVREARARRGMTEAGYLPTVDAGAGYSRQKQSENQPVLGSMTMPDTVSFENDVYDVGFDAGWEIDVFGGTRRAVEAASADLAAVEYGRRDAMVTVLGEVARNYVQTRGAQRELAILRDQVKAQEEAVSITRSRLDHGRATELDMQRAMAELAVIEAQVPLVESAIRRSIHRIGVLLAESPDALSDELCQAAALPIGPPEVPVGLPSDLLLRRPDVRGAERRLASQTARIGEIKADLFPRFFLTGSGGLVSIDSGDFISQASTVWSVGPSVRWRIFDAGRVRASMRAQEAVRDQAALAYEQVILGALEEVENALVAYAKEQEHRSGLERAVSANQRAVEIANQLYGAGLGSYLNLLDAQRALYRSQTDLVRSAATVTQNLIALYKALGGGWETETQQIKRGDSVAR